MKIVHRDVKMENILVCNTGYLKLADLGISKQLDEADAHMTQTQVGSPLYLAPEIASNDYYGTWVDWWSMGCIAYEMLFEESPFKGTRMREGEPNSVYFKRMAENLYR